MKKQILLLLAVILSTLTLVAQDYVGGTVRGKVKSTAGEELINAVVVFTDLQDSTKFYPSVCDAKGRYQQELPYGSYSYVVAYLGERCVK